MILWNSISLILDLYNITMQWPNETGQKDKTLHRKPKVEQQEHNSKPE